MILYTNTNYTLSHLRVHCLSDNIFVVENITDVVLALVCTILQGLSPPIAGVVCMVEGERANVKVTESEVVQTDSKSARR